MLRKSKIEMLVLRFLPDFGDRWLEHRCNILGHPWVTIPDPIPKDTAIDVIESLRFGGALIMNEETYGAFIDALENLRYYVTQA